MLVVDDDAGVREFCRDLLSSHGYLPLVAASPSDAVPLLSEEGQEIDIVILDYATASMNGISFVASIKRRYPNLPVILFTSSVLTSEDLPGGADAVLQKPCSPQLIIEQIQNLLERPAHQPRTHRTT